MASYFLSNKAVQDLSKIWEYTYEVWSENQADKYYFELLQDCQEIAEKPFLGRKYNKIIENLLGFKSGQHLFFIELLMQIKSKS